MFPYSTIAISSAVTIAKYAARATTAIPSAVAITRHTAGIVMALAKNFAIAERVDGATIASGVPIAKRAAGAAIAMARLVAIANQNYHGHSKCCCHSHTWCLSCHCHGQCCCYVANAQPLSECQGMDRVRKSQAMELLIAIGIFVTLPVKWKPQTRDLLDFLCCRARRAHVRESWIARSGQRLCCWNWGAGMWLQHGWIRWNVWCGTEPPGRRCWWWWWDHRLTARSKTKSRRLMVSSTSELRSGLGSWHWH